MVFITAFQTMWKEREWGFLEGIRGIALIWVMHLHVLMFHFPSKGWHALSGIDGKILKAWGRTGGAGVDLFFVMSGFLLGGTMYQEAKRRECISLEFAFKFLVRRIFKIYPAILGCMFLNWIRRGERAECPNPTWVENTFFVNSYLFDPRDKPVCMVQTWSITVELNMYLATPFFFWLCVAIWHAGKKRLGFSLFGVVLTMSLIAYLVWILIRVWHVIQTPDMVNRGIYQQEWPYYYQTHYRFGNYFIGIAAALIAIEKPDYLKPDPNDEDPDGFVLLWIFCALSFWMAFLFPFDVFPYGMQSKYMEDLCPGLWWAIRAMYVFGARPYFGLTVAYAMVYMSVGRGEWANWFLSHRRWRPIAALSYSVYLAQFEPWPIDQHVIERITSHLDLNTKFGGVVNFHAYIWVFTLGSFVYGLFVYALVELPCINFAKKLLDLCFGKRTQPNQVPLASAINDMSAAELQGPVSIELSERGHADDVESNREEIKYKRFKEPR